MRDHKTTTLWKMAFGNAKLSADDRVRAEQLLVAHNKIESRVAPMLEKIPESCRHLTIYDISHVHQLWDVASQICGPSYLLNPLEGFVLGAAFLIHDAGLTAVAYPDGVAGLKKTKYYLDRIAALLRSVAGEPPSAEALENPSFELAEWALFDTLRVVHAMRAETLLEFEKRHPLTGQPYKLLEDADLFLDCGEIIGLVAASHHWDIGDVEKRLARSRTPPAAYPNWEIDALKLACIVRAADACAIDERRARIMPFLLTAPEGVSRDHWQFQAYLNPGRAEGEALVFQSKRAFPRKDMSAWWTAYDAIEIADRELRDCDKVLRRHRSGNAEFVVRRVEGAGDAAQLQEYIRVEGWAPVNTSVRIDNPLAIVERFGGWQLYGDDYSAPLRELIQNAADSVRARRLISGGYDGGPGLPGRIDICINATKKDGKIGDIVLSVSDDGVGMPPDILTGDLLEFGHSFWGSEKASRIYPGLVSSPGFEPTGRFGIGFFAIFMIADDVKVISRPYQAGVRDSKTLHFHNGLKSRAEFRNYDAQEDGILPTNCCTVVSASVSRQGWLEAFASMSMWDEERNASRQRQEAQAFSWELVKRTLSSTRVCTRRGSLAL